MSKRLLLLNIHFAPRSFGGATIIAEEMAKRLIRDNGWEVLVVTTHHDISFPDYSVKRYKAKNINVISINLPLSRTWKEDYSNPHIDDLMEEIVELYEPDVVQAHSIQTLGCSWFEMIRDKGIPLSIFLHDCWWLCEQQFMITRDNRYCFQKKIDRKRCRYCVDDPTNFLSRAEYVKKQLLSADQLLAPSEFQRSLYLANGVDADKCFVNKNGINPPSATYRKLKNKGRVIFGFLGGPGPIKGAELIVKALNDLPDQTNYTLLIVDAAQNAGTTWRDDQFWRIPGNLTFVPPFDQESMDEFYGSIDVLLFPSQWKESFGLTVREALVRDVWIISTEAGGVTEDINSGINAHLLPLDGDYIPLRDAMFKCMIRNDWDQYINKHKALIRDFEKQAKELNDYLTTLID